MIQAMSDTIHEALPPKLNPDCQCICHHQPGVMHIVACCHAPVLDAAPQAAVVTVNAEALSDALTEGDGFWNTCSGCHESNEGHPTGPYSKALQCHLGGGCIECGGLGAVWDTTDYATMADELSKDVTPSPPSALSAAVAYERAAALMDEWWRGGVDTGVPADMIRALPHPTEAELDAAALARPVVRALVEALEPFAKYMIAEDGRMDQDHMCRPLPDKQGVGWIYLTYQDFRRAEAAISAAKGA